MKTYSVLLGAGASMDAGVPTSRRLLDSYLEGCADEDGVAIRKAMVHLGDRGTGVNIESVAQLVSNDNPDLYRTLRSHTLRSVQEIGDSAYLAQLFHPDLCAHFGFCLNGEPVFKERRRSTTRVFSLNYDFAIEKALGEKAPYLALFQAEPYPRFVYHPGVAYDRAEGNPDLTKDSNGPQFPDFRRPGVVKLHGSLSWRWEDFGADRKLVASDEPPGGAEPEIIFAEPEKLRMTQPYRDLFFVFSVSLSNSAALFTIGYSWADSHINRVIAEQVARGLEIVNVDPSPPDASTLRGICPDNTLWVHAGCADALLGREVEYAIGEGKAKTESNGLVGIVRNELQGRLWKTEEESRRFKSED